MCFNRKNAEQKNWRMIKKGKHFLFGCSLVFAVGATLVAPSVKADTVEAKPETSSTTDGTKPVVSEENPTYAAPAVEVAPVVATGEKAEKPVEPTQNSEEEPVVATEKAKEADSIQAPEVTVVYNPAALTDEEKAKVVAAVKAANPTATDVQVQADGSVVVAFADGSRANLTAAQTIKDGSLVAKPRSARAARATAPRETAGSTNLDYTNKENVEGYIKVTYEVDNAKNVVHWTVLDNGAHNGNSASGYAYFTIPKDSVGEPTNWKVVQTDKNGKVLNTRDYWKNNDGSYVMGAKGQMNTYTGAEMTKRLTQLFKETKNPAIKGKEAEVAAQTAARSQALYSMTADIAGKKPSWTITFDTPILDKSKPFDFVAGMQGTGVVGGRTNIMTGYTDNYMEAIKFQAVAVKEKYVAKVGESFNTDPATYVTNKAGTPEFPNNYRGATTFAWKDGQAPTATTPGTYTKTVVVTYPAHYKQAPQEVTITFEVKDPRSDADKYTPVAKDQTVKPGDKPSAKDSIGNVGDLPEGTTFEFKTPVDTATDGEKDATVVVTYPDKSTEEVPVKVTVKTPDADKYTPVAKEQNVNKGETPDAKGSIGNVGDLPEGTTFEFKTPVDTATPGDKDATVVVTYPDKSTEEVPAKVTVKTPSTDADKYTPVAKDQTVKPGDKPSAKDSIGNVGDLPSGTTFEFKTPVDTATDGEKDATVVVTYPDGSKDEVPAKVTVKTPTKEANAPSVTPVVNPSSLTEAEKAKVANEVKKANPTATDVEVNNDGTVVVTFADGSVAVLASEKVVKEATKESPAQEPSKKAGAKELPNTGTKQSSASLALALLAAATGGLLISKKRKEGE